MPGITAQIVDGNNNPTGVTLLSGVAEDGVATGLTAIGIALEARNTQKTAMSATGDVVRAQGTMDGRQVFVLNAIPELAWFYAAAAAGIVSSTTDVVVKTAGGATVRNYVSSIQISHDLLSVVTEIVVKDGATVIWRGKLQVAASESASTIDFDTPLRGSLNTAVNVALLTSATGGVYVNVQGFTAT